MTENEKSLNNLIGERNLYRNQIEIKGVHSFLGKFYAKEYQKRFFDFYPHVVSIINNASSLDFNWSQLVEGSKSVFGFNKDDVFKEIMSVVLEVDSATDFEDLVISATMNLGENLGFENEESFFIDVLIFSILMEEPILEVVDEDLEEDPIDLWGTGPLGLAG